MTREVQPQCGNCYVMACLRTEIYGEKTDIARKIHLWLLLTNLEVAGLQNPCVSPETPRLPRKEHLEVELSLLPVPF